jgi:hypothetical protein
MARRGETPRLTVEVSFETTRTSRQCLIKAYESAVPITRRRLRTAETQDAISSPEAMCRRADNA